MGKTLGKDCVEYNACVELPLMGIFPCYQFPGNSAYDSVCTDVPAEEFVPGTLGYRSVCDRVTLRFIVSMRKKIYTGTRPVFYLMPLKEKKSELRCGPFISCQLKF